jgi:NAD(P)-dependent dehydrogenase (short-subunit alcohol dehydrogenase family)
MADLDGQVAIVTGGASGIGKATALVLARDGADIAVFDVNEETAQGTVAEIEKLGRRGLALAVDVSEADSVVSAVARVAETLSGPDILVNVAAIGSGGPLLECSKERFERVIAVNLTGTFLMCQAAGRRMAEKGYGRIVNFASGQWFRPGPGSGAYGASKAGVVSLSRCLAQELGGNGVMVNVIAPGLTDTPMTRAGWPTDDALRERARVGQLANVIGRPLQPAEVADAVAFLVGPRARAITGQTLHVNAGSLMW